jgi:acetyltransferase-like isoleucine patch superfamily enzyme
LSDRAFLGAGRPRDQRQAADVATPGRVPPTGPTFGKGCKVGTGVVLPAGVIVGVHGLVGAGSVVTPLAPLVAAHAAVARA